jgi:hypothetical protein
MALIGDVSALGIGTAEEKATLESVVTGRGAKLSRGIAALLTGLAFGLRWAPKLVGVAGEGCTITGSKDAAETMVAASGSVSVVGLGGCCYRSQGSVCALCKLFRRDLASTYSVGCFGLWMVESIIKGGHISRVVHVRLIDLNKCSWSFEMSD